MSERVNICVIVGNGFDLAAGLETSTEVFVKRFAEQHINDDSPAGRLAAQIQRDDSKSWADFEWKIGEYASVVGNGSDEAIEEYIEAKSAMEMDLVEFIKACEDRVDSDKVGEAAEVCISSICEWVGALTPVDQRRVRSQFSSPYSLDISFVTLNYTHLLDKMFELQRSSATVPYATVGVEGYRLGRCIHAHGALAGNAICGVDNPTQIQSDILAGDDGVLETVVKSATQRMLGSLDDDDARTLIDFAEVIMIYGCSMGETDARWWKAIIERLRSSASRRFVVLFSHGFERNGRSAADVRNCINALKQRLFDSAGIPDAEDKRELFDRIFILPSSVILKMPKKLVVTKVQDVRAK